MTTTSRLAALCLSLAALLALAAEPREVEATGEAAVIGDKAQARDKAIEDALRRAVEQACGTLVAAETQVRDNQLVSDRILTKAKGYVSGYDVTSEKEEKGVVRVTVRAKVGTDKLADDLAAIGLVLQRKGLPTILVLIGEQAIDDKTARTWWSKEGKTGVISLDRGIVESELVSSWLPQGFRFIDHETLSGALEKKSALSQQVGDKSLLRMADLVAADITIHGDANVIPYTADVMGVKKAGCAGTLKLVATAKNGDEKLAEVKHDQTHLHPVASACSAELLKRMTRKLEKELKEQLLAKWNQQLAGGGIVKLKVAGADFSSARQLKANLASLVRGVKDVAQFKMSGKNASMDVVGELSAEALGEALDGKKVNKRTVRVTGVEANTLSIELTK